MENIFETNVLDSNEAKVMDKLTIESGIMEETLMEQAAFAIADVASSFSPKKILCVAGTGNNGGDCIAAGRILHNKGYNVEIYIYGKNQSNGFKKQLLIAENYGLKIKYNKDFSDEYDLIIDGLIGIGLNGEVRSSIKTVIEKINSSNAKVISEDIPSGISSDTGEVMGDAVHADITITFGNLKIGQILYPGREFSGKLKIAELSFKKFISNRKIITPDIIKVPNRKKDSHKYDYGNVLILAGSSKYPGAPILTALGAQRIGAGLVTLITPGDSSKILSFEPSIIYSSLNKNNFEKNDLKKLNDEIERANVIILGPGMTEDSIEFVVELIKKQGRTKNIVLDAESIQAIKEFESLSENILITPHVGEMKKIFKNLKNNIFELERFSKQKKCIIMLKSSITTITDGEKTFFNLLGSSSLSKGGSGDLLSGIVGGLIAQGLDTINACITGSYIMYKTAKELSNEYTEYFITPKLISENLYIGFKL
ncbi:bifunctional NAD(P)H-hydrate repair enzyme Nnr [Tepiditoga spiralis]|uniref:Bifunctional NAD(P)H-hydrate repair enzyme n=1 Tax=Tepiditoga spiralis TaxID=2108365 RepID=A0A7G1G5F2_9BACT|nr:NAD(P)H-hydrate dehydratase [Tepiditoga spiralis]BBE31631.1 bifunctional NAD(P)H-hydrate repair enzyme Nnr [Tepiditoga spiralis]